MMTMQHCCLCINSFFSFTYKSQTLIRESTLMNMCIYTHTYSEKYYNLAPSSKLHASLFTPRGHSTSWPVGQQAVQLISGEPPLSRERHMVNSKVTSQQITAVVTRQQSLCSGIINLFVSTSGSTLEVHSPPPHSCKKSSLECNMV